MSDGRSRERLIHLRREPWDDSARVSVEGTAIVATAPTLEAAQEVAAHLVAMVSGMPSLWTTFDVETTLADDSIEVIQDWRCSTPTWGWDVSEPVERRFWNQRFEVEKRLADFGELFGVLAVPRGDWSVAISYAESQKRATFATIGRLWHPLADLIAPHGSIGAAAIAMGWLLPQMLLDRAEILEILGSEDALHFALTLDIYPERCTEELLTRMEETWLSRRPTN